MSAGFTLVELLIVVACIAILASLAIPNLVASRATTNERAVLATLRTIATAQAQVVGSNALDSDRDGNGEALTLPELASMIELRGTSIRLTPSALSVALGLAGNNGFVRTKGYLIALYLPDAMGNGVLGTPANFGSIDPDGAEHSWTCLAWPEAGDTGSGAAFFLSQDGEILTARGTSYRGPANVPAANAALVGVTGSTIVGGRTASNEIGADGNTWLPVQ